MGRFLRGWRLVASRPREAGEKPDTTPAVSPKANKSPAATGNRFQLGPTWLEQLLPRIAAELEAGTAPVVDPPAAANQVAARD